MRKPRSRYCRNAEIAKLLDDLQGKVYGEEAVYTPEFRSWFFKVLTKFGTKERQQARRLDIDESMKNLNRTLEEIKVPKA